MLSRRKALGSVDVSAWSSAIQFAALDLFEYHAARSVAFYCSVQNEVATDLLLEHSLAAEKLVFYPKIGAANHAELVRVCFRDELCVGRFGIPEPRGSEVLSASQTAALTVFVPGVAFDLAGNRLGRGAGYYDRLLSRLPGSVTIVGLAYEFQVVSALPVDAWDRPVHYLVTERRVIDCVATPAQSVPIS